MKAFLVVYQGVVGEAVCGIPSHVRVVQHRRKKCQDRPHRQRHCVAGTPNLLESALFTEFGPSFFLPVPYWNWTWQWTWAATILQSSNVAWEYGVSGPF
ncbi:hypothetical protein BHE74_00053732 [Ensete ventricosum]|nr:hypothetical protein BHE74_00053732 [Ensete ventricosum]